MWKEDQVKEERRRGGWECEERERKKGLNNDVEKGKIR
jgi:hypothetical protein